MSMDDEHGKYNDTMVSYHCKFVREVKTSIHYDISGSRKSYD